MNAPKENKMKKTILYSLLLVGLGTTGAFADAVFSGGGTTSNWMEAANWTPAIAPTNAANVDARIAINNAGKSQADLTGETLDFGAKDMRIGVANADGARLNLNTGTTLTLRRIELGFARDGILNVNDGATLNATGFIRMSVGADDSSVLTIDGGIINTGLIRANASENATELQIHNGGLLSVDTFSTTANNSWLNTNAVITISEGTFRIDNENDVDELAGMITDGAIVITGSSYTLDLDGTDTVLTVIPEPATLGLIAIAGMSILFVRRFTM